MLFGFKTVAAGEEGLLRNHRGEAQLVAGPARITLWRSKLEILQR